MPKVGNKHFAYTLDGEAAARRYAKATGGTVEHGLGSKGGGGNELSGNKPRPSGRQPSASRRKAYA